MPELAPLLIDLALDPGPTEGIPELAGPCRWDAELHSWLDAIRNDPHLDCPEAVRQADELSLGLRFCDDAAIAELNQTWRQRNGPTDVLSFAALDDLPDDLAQPSLELGDIIISIDTARRQAAEHGHSLLDELRWLLSHGLLHLLGWDHPDDGALSVMLRQQELLLAISHNIWTREPNPVVSQVNSDAH